MSTIDTNELLTRHEHQAMDLTSELWHLITSEIVGEDESREEDLRELAAHVHAIQNAILAQAAGRAFPYLYRTMGEQITFIRVVET